MGETATVVDALEEEVQVTVCVNEPRGVLNHLQCPYTTVCQLGTSQHNIRWDHLAFMNLLSLTTFMVCYSASSIQNIYMLEYSPC